jgi:hypothetical protein
MFIALSDVSAVRHAISGTWDVEAYGDCLCFGEACLVHEPECVYQVEREGGEGEPWVFYGRLLDSGTGRSLPISRCLVQAAGYRYLGTVETVLRVEDAPCLCAAIGYPA